MAQQDYSDIIGMEHHQSERHPHMSNYDRAAQFSPFAALTGYDDCITEAARLTEGRIELDGLHDQLLPPVLAQGNGDSLSNR